MTLLSTMIIVLGDKLSICTQRKIQRIHTDLQAVFGHLEKENLCFNFTAMMKGKRTVTRGDGNGNTTCLCKCTLCATAVWLMKESSIYGQLLSTSL